MNKELISFSLSPNHLLNKSAEEALKKVALHSVAAALANNVLPQPGGPNNKIPDQGLRAPVNNSGFIIGRTIASLNACFTFSNPAMSFHFTLGDSVTIVPDIISISSCSSDETASKSAFDSPSFDILGLPAGLALLGRIPLSCDFNILALSTYSSIFFWHKIRI